MTQASEPEKSDLDVATMYSTVGIPTPLMPELDAWLGEHGWALDMIEDDEDGHCWFGAKPSSAAMVPHLEFLKRHRNMAAAAFAISVAFFVFASWAWLAAASAASIVMGLTGANAALKWRDWQHHNDFFKELEAREL